VSQEKRALERKVSELEEEVKVCMWHGLSVSPILSIKKTSIMVFFMLKGYFCYTKKKFFVVCDNDLFILPFKHISFYKDFVLDFFFFFLNENEYFEN